MKKGLVRNRRIPRLEALEDRTLLSGVVTAVLNPTTGVLSIAGDPGNNNITISQLPGFPTTLVPTLRVAGVVTLPSAPPFVPDFTSVNSVTFTDFTLSSITSINVDFTQGGNDKITMAGFVLPNNITISANGAGTDVFSLSNITANKITIANAGAAKNTISLTNVVAGSATITTGAGADSVTMSAVTIGTASISTGGGGDTVIVTASPASPAPIPPGGPARPALGVLSISTGAAAGGTNTILVGVTAAGAAAPVTAGIIILSEGDAKVNIVKLDNSSFNQAGITTGKTSGGDPGANNTNIEVLNNTIKTAAGLSITAGLGGGTLHKIVVSNNVFTGGGLLTINIGDGIVYWDAKGVLVPALESSIVVDNDTGVGAASITVGKFFFNTTVGATAATPLVGKSLTLNVGDDEDFVTLNKVLSGDENVTIGTQVDALAPAWTFSQAGSVGGSQTINAGLGTPAGHGFASFTDSATVGVNLTINLGNGDGTINITSSAGPKGTEIINVGNGSGTINLGGGPVPTLTIGVGNGHTLNVTTNVTGALVIGAPPGGTANGVTLNVGPAVGPPNETVGSLSITLGTGATVTVQNVTSTGAASTTGDISIVVGDSPNSIAVLSSTVFHDLNITAGNGKTSPDSSLIYIFGDTINNNLNVTTGTTGNYTMSLVNSLILDQLAVTLGGGINTVFAQAVTALFGNIEGGGNPASTYFDLGGNFGFTQSGFSGYF